MPRCLTTIEKTVRGNPNLGSTRMIEALEDRQLLSLVVDLRLAGGGKTVAATHVGQVVQLEAWAVITGSQNTSAKALQLLEGSFLSTNVGAGAALGTLAVTNLSPFAANASAPGAQTDLDGDADLDVGSNNASSAVNYFVARSETAMTDPEAGTGPASFKVATLTFTVSKFLGGTQTQLNFSPRAAFSGALWLEDGAEKFGTTGVFAAGDPVTFTRSTTGPTRKVKALGVTTAAKAYNFTVTYTDPDMLLASSIGSTNIQVTGPKAFKQTAKLISKTPAGNGQSIVATYRIIPPGGKWVASRNGVYSIALVGNRVADLLGNYAAAGKLGTFTVKLAK